MSSINFLIIHTCHNNRTKIIIYLKNNLLSWIKNNSIISKEKW